MEDLKNNKEKSQKPAEKKGCCKPVKDPKDQKNIKTPCGCGK